MATASFDHALNDGEVTVWFYFDPFNIRDYYITQVRFKDADVYGILHPEDRDYLEGLVPEKVREAAEDLKAEAAEMRREADRDE